MRCAACGGANPDDKRFCGDCGDPLTRQCPACGATADKPAQRFCGDCGSPLDSATPDGGRQHATSQAEAIAGAGGERRLVTVLFMDLVGFTPLGDGRDPEDIREILDGYFRRSAAVVERYGGLVEKFIGDAVMAVWGTPVAREDDAERAVRAALALVEEVEALGVEVGAGLDARVGILTGEVVTRAASVSQGMVIGDAVNTAARIQSVAEPGTVFVDRATRMAAEAAVVFEDEGERTLKGKREPVRVWRAVRVISVRGGNARRTSQIEAPFVGRQAELRMLRDALHEVAGCGALRLVTVLGLAGMGKSRLAWELEKYVDGITLELLWHRAHCPAHGDGVAFWALAEMVRARCAVSQDDTSSQVRQKLRTSLAEIASDAGERRIIETRLAVLLGAGDGGGADQADLFAAWRLFFERLSDRAPVVLVFEDLHWGDAGLLAFISHLTEWSAARPIFILALGRPELALRRPDLCNGAIELPPLSDDAMDELLTSVVSDLPTDAIRRIRRRADGVPLYAVETLRMLLDHGVIAKQDERYHVVGELQDIGIPETLQALIAARIDSLPESQRRVVHDAAVLGQQFTVEGVAAVGGLDEPVARALLDRLVSVQVVDRVTDDRSPEHDEYAFLQGTMREVAYGMLARPNRRTRHLRAAGYFEKLADRRPVLAEVVADHLLATIEADPHAQDAFALRGRARRALVAAGERAAAVAALQNARAAFERAAALADEPADQAELLIQSANAARMLDARADAVASYRKAQELTRVAGNHRRAAALSATISEAQGYAELPAQAAELEAARAMLNSDHDAALGQVCQRLGLVRYGLGDRAGARAATDEALAIAEALEEPLMIVQAFRTKVALVGAQESIALGEHALQLTRTQLSHGASGPWAQAHLALLHNYAAALAYHDRLGRALELYAEALDLALRRGDRWAANFLHSNASVCAAALGRWEDLDRHARALPDDAMPRLLDIRDLALLYAAARCGTLDTSLRNHGTQLGAAVDSADETIRAVAVTARAVLPCAEEDPAAAAAALPAALALLSGGDREIVRMAVALVAETLIGSEQLDALRDLVAHLEPLAPGERGLFLTATLERCQAALAGADRDLDLAEQRASLAQERLTSIDRRVEAAAVAVERAERLGAAARAAEADALLDMAAPLLEELHVQPWVARARRARASRTERSPDPAAGRLG